MSDKPVIRFGSIVRLRHVQTGSYLRSLSRQYTHGNTSGQQMVVGTADDTPETYWIVKPAHQQPESNGSPPSHSSVITLEHWATRMNLHSHDGRWAPITNTKANRQREVTAFGQHGQGDDNDNWRVEVEGGGAWIVGQPIRLVHVNTKAALHSHKIHDPNLTAGEQEITGFDGRDQNDLWVVSEIIVPFPTAAQVGLFVGASEANITAMHSYPTSLGAGMGGF